MISSSLIVFVGRGIICLGSRGGIAVLGPKGGTYDHANLNRMQNQLWGLAEVMATIKEIAQLSGVSRATVSAVLNNKPTVRAGTRNKVLQTIREHGLQNRLIARTLMGHFSQMIGVVVPNLRNPFYTELIWGMTSALKAHGNHMVAHSSDESYEDEVETLETLMGYDLGGYVLASVQEEAPSDHVRKVLETGKPFVAIEEVSGLETSVVDFDEAKGSKEATDYLVKKGHRKIVCLAARRGTAARNRVLGFMESLLDHDLKFDDSMVVKVDANSEGGYRNSLDLLKNASSRPSAIVCFNDLVAIGVYRAAHELGLRIPDDLSVVGFDDIDIASVLGPPLTTVSIHAEEAGRTAAEILLAEMKGECDRHPVHKTMPAELIKRGSVRAV